MTWKELKENVTKLGVKDDETIYCIKVTYPKDIEDLFISRPYTGEIEIRN